MKKSTTLILVRAGIISALYAVLTMAFAFSSFATAMIQFRISEVLCILPLFFPEAVPGLWIGCMLGNIIGGNPIDIFFGSFATLLAAVLTFIIGRTVKPVPLKIALGAFPPVIVNALLVPMTFTIFIGSPEIYWIQTLWVFIGQMAVLYVGGVPFAAILQTKYFKKGKKVKNAAGQDLDEFLKEYNPSKYDKPSVTADCIIISQNKVLMVRRGNHPCIGQLAFPGGFCEKGESTEQTAARELKEETGADAPLLRQIYVSSTPGRDPRDWIMTVNYLAVLDAPIAVSGSDDAASANWYDIKVDKTNADGQERVTITLTRDGEIEKAELAVVRDGFNKVDVNCTKVLSGSIAFDHAKTLLRAIEEL